MGQQKMPADIRRAVTEWAERGFTVLVDLKSGELKIMPATHKPTGDAFDQVDMTR